LRSPRDPAGHSIAPLGGSDEADAPDEMLFRAQELQDLQPELGVGFILVPWIAADPLLRDFLQFPAHRNRIEVPHHQVRSNAEPAGQVETGIRSHCTDNLAQVRFQQSAGRSFPSDQQQADTLSHAGLNLIRFLPDRKETALKFLNCSD